ncbi:hypothetical protein BX661DRAFT_198665 [Kickxella alabastrina]|uniref:uncharacterized protein n=1 Tax=Kickxella alabastrina TaxID=61397 RepID=UPI00221F6B81|nr:uncharacterized protein BX661DRAFT_198665 [Kickxella alabastrina]KAI7827389.1 hypothetical protein BX661DRAFT_198665 [Kickxella alabastrina]
MHKGSSNDPAISITLKFPDPTLNFPLAHDSASLCSSQRSLFVPSVSRTAKSVFSMRLDAESELRLQKTDRIVIKEVSIPDCSVDRRLYSARAKNKESTLSEGNHMQAPMAGLSHVHQFSPSPVASEFVAAGSGPECDWLCRYGRWRRGLAQHTGYDKLLHKRPMNTTISSTNTTISSVDPWSSPLDMESTMTQVDNAADANYNDMGLIEDEFAECDEVHRLGDQANIPRLSPAGSNFEMISSMDTPISPRTLASPCGSSDFEMIPQSPSISWLYDGAPSDTLSQHHLSLLINPRTTSMIKSVSSPGCLITSGPSLFSPPPVHFHQKFFESRRINMSPFRSSSDPPAAAKDNCLHA